MKYIKVYYAYSFAVQLVPTYIIKHTIIMSTYLNNFIVIVMIIIIIIIRYNTNKIVFWYVGIQYTYYTYHKHLHFIR